MVLSGQQPPTVFVRALCVFYHYVSSVFRARGPNRKPHHINILPSTSQTNFGNGTHTHTHTSCPSSALPGDGKASATFCGPSSSLAASFKRWLRKSSGPNTPSATIFSTLSLLPLSLRPPPCAPSWEPRPLLLLLMLVQGADKCVWHEFSGGKSNKGAVRL